jgi:hypothetical protein
VNTRRSEKINNGTKSIEEDKRSVCEDVKCVMKTKTDRVKRLACSDWKLCKRATVLLSNCSYDL